MKIKHSVRKIEAGAEKEFRNQIIYDRGSFKFNNFAYGQFNNFDAGAAAAQQALVSRLNPTAATLTIVITNSSQAATSVTIFNVGGGQTGAQGLTPTFADGVTVTCPQSTYSQVLISLLSKVFKIGGLKYACQNRTQLSNSFILGYSNERGTYTRQAYTPRYMGNNMQNVQTEIDDPTFQMDVSVDSFITLTVNGTAVVSGGENVELTFTIAGIKEPVRALSGQPSLAVNPEGFQSGIPAQTLVVSNQPMGGGLINLGAGAANVNTAGPTRGFYGGGY
jgi:hypothetical protein